MEMDKQSVKLVYKIMEECRAVGKEGVAKYYTVYDDCRDMFRRKSIKVYTYKFAGRLSRIDSNGDVVVAHPAYTSFFSIDQHGNGQKRPAREEVLKRDSVFLSEEDAIAWCKYKNQKRVICNCSLHWG